MKSNCNNKYYYNVYGLNIESEMLVPEFSTIENNELLNIDVKISFGVMPTHIKDMINRGRNANYEKQNMWFHIKDLGTYHIYNGDTVVIEPYENADKQILKIYVMGSVLGMVLLQRDAVAIHGGSIVINNKGYIFTGDKGAGKSTLTTALRLRGYDFISDDVASIKMEGTNSIYPGFGYQKLCEDAMVKLGYDTNEFAPFRSDMSIKYIVPALDSFVDEEVELGALFELEVGDVEQVEIVEIKGNEKLNKLIKNVFRIEMIMYSGGMNPVYLKKCIDIAKSIKCYKIIRPKNQFSVDEQISLIEDVIYSNREDTIAI